MSDTTASTAAAETIDLDKPVEIYIDGIAPKRLDARVLVFAGTAIAIDADGDTYKPMRDGRLCNMEGNELCWRIRNVPSPASPEPEAKGGTRLWREGQRFNKPENLPDNSDKSGWCVINGRVMFQCSFGDCDSSCYDVESFSRAIASRELVPVDPAPTVEKAAPRQTFSERLNERMAEAEWTTRERKFASAIADAYEASQGKE